MNQLSIYSIHYPNAITWCIPNIAFTSKQIQKTSAFLYQPIDLSRVFQNVVWGELFLQVQNQVLAMLQFGLHDPRAWLQAGALSALLWYQPT